VALPSPLPQVRVIGRYALYDEIASGGMATVHIGRLLGPVGFSRTVAIKRLHPQFAKEPDFVSMFLDEARLAARIRHPNVVGTLDVVALDGELFLVMEYVQGESLGRLMRTMRERGECVPIPIAAAIVLGVLEGLHAAHEATSDQGEPLGIVHRDVSPQNILVGTDGVARVVDFGVAKAAGRVQSTRNGQLKGKLGYMAPEQISGHATRATDVHAVAVVLWEMLTARRLFQAENELQTFSNILSGELVAPSTYAPNVPAEIDNLVMKGLEPRPEARFPSARDMARAIQRTARIASPSDVGDWVAATGGANIGSRARKIAAIESSGVLPAAASSSPEPIDTGRISQPTSAPPVSGEHLRVRRGRVAVVLPIGLAAISIGAVIGLLLRDARPPGPAGAASGAKTLPALAVAVRSPPAPPPSPPVGVAPSPPGPASPATGSASAPIYRPPVTAIRPWMPPAPPAPAASVVVRVQPAPPVQPPAAGGADFTHVMDSRK
jgi:serine/threonine-protein kinase